MLYKMGFWEVPNLKLPPFFQIISGCGFSGLKEGKPSCSFLTPDGLTPLREASALIWLKEDAQMRIQDLELINDRRDWEAYLPIVIFVNVSDRTHEWRGMCQIAPKGSICSVAYIGFSKNGEPVSIIVDRRCMQKVWGQLNWLPHDLVLDEHGFYVEFRKQR